MNKTYSKCLFSRYKQVQDIRITKQNTFLDNLANISICFPSTEICICICVYNAYTTKLLLTPPLLFKHKILSSTLLTIRNKIKKNKNNYIQDLISSYFSQKFLHKRFSFEISVNKRLNVCKYFIHLQNY